MFGFGKSEAGRLAGILVPTVAYYLAKYGNCEDSAFIEAIRHEVPEGHLAIAGSSAQLAPLELRDFQLLIGPPPFGSAHKKRQVAVVGRARHAGFGLVADGPKSDWFTYAGGGGMPSRSAARKLVQTLCSGHGIRNADDMQRQWPK